MASKKMCDLLKTKTPLGITSFLCSKGKLFHSTPVCEGVTSGRVKISPKRNKPVTYERWIKPPSIAHRKSFNSWNTTTIEGGLRTAETTFDDIFLRKFITGTFHNMVESEIIIKRHHNIIRIAMILYPTLPPSKICFLIGYTEEILSYWLQCLVKLEIQTISSRKDVIFKYI